MFAQRPFYLSLFFLLSLLASPVFAADDDDKDKDKDDDDKKCKDNDGNPVKCGPFANTTKLVIFVSTCVLFVIVIVLWTLVYIRKRKAKKVAAAQEAANPVLPGGPSYPQQQGQMSQLPAGESPYGYQQQQQQQPYRPAPVPAYAAPASYHPPYGAPPAAGNPFNDPSHRV